MDYIPYSHQCIEEDDIRAVVEVLKSDWLTTGPKVEEFEKALAAKVGASYAVTFSSGTAALHGAYFAAGVGPGDEVVTTPITFAATANAALYLGGRPAFVDVRPDTVNIDPMKIEAAITSRTRVLAPVDFAGQPADIDEIMAIASKHGLIVVEDAAHSLGATYHGRPVGSLADMTVFSFHPVKAITTGEGGAVVTNNQVFYEKLRFFRNHGIVRDADKLSKNDGPWFYEMQMLGFNYRLTDIQCALGVNQLKKLERFLKRRREIADIYTERLKALDQIELPRALPDRSQAWHLYPVKLTGDKPNRRKVFASLQARGIGVQVHYLPVYWHPHYQQLGYEKAICPHAEDYYMRCLSLPVFPAMTDREIERVIQALHSIFI